ncbi:MAG: hypothetical protein R3D45_16900 [Rhizobiaceae bacterium]
MECKRGFVVGGAAIFLVASLSAGLAGGLSGNRGTLRAMGQYPAGGCSKLFDRYVAASGHSAYATTVVSQYSAAVCGIALNKRSKADAEKAALKACQQGDKKWKVEQLGGCYLGASK